MTTTPEHTRKRRAYAARIPEAQRRTELLDAALHLVVTHGHNAATMAAVAEQAGVTKPVVYSVFANRADLLSALLRREQEQATQQLMAVVPPGFGESSKHRLDDQLAELLQRFLAAVGAAPERWHCILARVPDMPAEFHAANEHGRALTLMRIQELTDELLRSIDAPAELDSEIVAQMLLGLLESAARLVLADPEHFRPERFVLALRAVFGRSAIRWA